MPPPALSVQALPASGLTAGGLEGSFQVPFYRKEDRWPVRVEFGPLAMLRASVSAVTGSP